jgi:hypothetical protein
MPTPLSLADINENSRKALEEKMMKSGSPITLQHENTKELQIENEINHLNLKPNSKGLIHIR